MGDDEGRQRDPRWNDVKQFCQEFEGPLLRQAISWLRRRDLPMEAARDAVQEALAVGFGRGFQGVHCPRSYLWGIARNVLRKIAREMYRWQELPEEGIVGCYPEPDETLSREQEAALVNRAVRELCEESRQIILIKYFPKDSGNITRTDPQLAVELGISYSVFRYRLDNAKKTLRFKLASLRDMSRHEENGARRFQ